jgi:hypothetical protein
MSSPDRSVAGAAEGSPGQAEPDSSAGRARRDRVRSWAPDLAVVLFAGAAVALLFPGVLVGREHLWGDFFTWYFPSHEYAASRIRGGAWPLWNPYSNSGMPFMAEADHGTAYPLSWLLHVLVPDRWSLYHGLELFVLLHAVLAILTVYALLRVLGCGRAAALTGGLAYGLSGSFAARAGHVSLVCAEAWVPAALGGFFVALRHDRLRGLIVSALAVGMIGLSGSPATLVVTLMGLGMLLPGTLLGDVRGRPFWRRGLRGVGAFAAVATVGLSVAAVQLLPMKEFVGLSERSAYTYEQVSSYAVTRASLIMLIVPRFFGWLDYTQPSYWGPNNFVELSGYAGVLPLALGALALRFRRFRDTAPWLLLSALALWIALGAQGGLHRVVFELVPLLGAMRAPGRYLLLWAFGVAVLAGLGLDAALREARGPRRETWRRWLSACALVTGTLAVSMLLITPAVVTVLQSWQVRFFVRGQVLAAIAAGGAMLAFLVLQRSTSALAAGFVVLLVANDLTVQGRGVGVIAEAVVRTDLREPAQGYTVDLRNDPALFRIRNRYETPAELMVARLQSDYGPGRHVLDYQDFDRRILSHDSPLLDVLNVKYLGEVRHRLVESPMPSLLAQQYALLSVRGELVLAVDPPVEADGLEVVSTAFAASAASPGQVLGEIRLESDGGETAVVPIRKGIETADAAERGVVTAAREIRATFFIDVSDAAAFRRAHYLAKLQFPALRVSRIRLRGVDREWGLAFKELYLVPRGPDTGGWHRVRSERADADRVLNVYENTNVMPRATLVSRSRLAGSRPEALDLVSRLDFDPRTEVVLEKTGAPPAEPAAEAGAGATAGTVGVDRYEAERIALSADVAAPGGWLVLSEVFYPGWTASVDGAPAAILRADGVFRAVRLEAGHHTVDFRYQPRSFRDGLRVSGATTAVLCFVLAVIAAPTMRSRLPGLRSGPGLAPPPPPGRG